MLSQFTALQMIYLVPEPFNYTAYIDEDGEWIEELASMNERFLVKTERDDDGGPDTSDIDEVRSISRHVKKLATGWKVPDVQYARVDRPSEK